MPFNEYAEYAQAMLEQDAAAGYDLHQPKLTFEQIAATDMTSAEIEAEYAKRRQPSQASPETLTSRI